LLHAVFLHTEESLSVQLSRLHKVSQSVWNFYTSSLKKLEQKSGSPDSERLFAEMQQQQQVKQGPGYPIAAAEGEVELAQIPQGIEPQAAHSQKSSSFSLSGWLRTPKWLSKPGRQDFIKPTAGGRKSLWTRNAKQPSRCVVKAHPCHSGTRSLDPGCLQSLHKPG
jgi:hypothetical protein